MSKPTTKLIVHPRIVGLPLKTNYQTVASTAGALDDGDELSDPPYYKSSDRWEKKFNRKKNEGNRVGGDRIGGNRLEGVGMISELEVCTIICFYCWRWACAHMP